ncbi:MAG TPA: hypothetical protein VF247_02285 [Candidatus Krumholzibacteria bacterium]
MITRTSIGTAARRLVAGTVTVCLLGAGFSRTGVVESHAQANTRVYPAVVAAPDPAPAPAPRAGSEHFLRDAIPAASFAAAEPDTTDDDFVLPEEKSRSQLVKEIAVWVLAAAFVAFFIVKVFIQEDDEPADDGNNGKPIPLPE